MTPLRALIIDDEPLAHRVILEYCKEIPLIEVVGQSYLATEALAVLNEQKIDLLFLDIQMPKLTGLEFLQTLPIQPIVIITSAYKEYALESFEFDVCDYLLKPFRFNRFLKSVNKAVEWHQLKQAPPATPATAAPVTDSIEDFQLFIKADKRHIQLDLREVFYLESHGNYVKVWMGEKFHLTASTLSGFAEQLPQSLFYRIHKSFVVNIRHVNYVEGNFLQMKNGQQLPIGKNQRLAFKQFIGKTK